MMMSNKSGKKAIGKNCAADSNNLFISWNKDDNMYIPIKLKIPVKNKNLSAKKIKITSFPLLEDSQKKKKVNSSFKLLSEKENAILIPKIQKLNNEQTKTNNILPKINTTNRIVANNKNDRKRKSFSYFKDNKNNMAMNNNYNLNNRKNSFEKKIIKNYCALSQAGKNSEGITKTNQDSYLVLTKINNFTNFNVFAVFDGHGPDGHLISQFLVRYFTDFFNNNPEIKKCSRELEVFNLFLHSNYKLLHDSIALSEEKLKEQKNINCQYSGSTCCMLIQIYQKIICANIGDSRAILISEMIKEDTVNLSNDHKPNLKKELERIKKYGGVVEKCLYEDGVFDGPYRVWNSSKQEYPGLAVSRSIGDTEATKLGVLAEPEFNLKTLKSNMKYIVIASDGIWEFLNNKDVSEIIKPFYNAGDAKGAVEELIKQSREKWASDGESADDITVIIIFF